MASISFPLPGIVRVVDTEDEHGVPVKILYILDTRVAYYVGDMEYMGNEDWEEIVNGIIARFFGRMLCQESSFGDQWTERNPTGNEIYSRHNVTEYVIDRGE